MNFNKDKYVEIQQKVLYGHKDLDKPLGFIHNSEMARRGVQVFERESRSKFKCTASDYTDRFSGWDYDRFRRLQLETLGSARDWWNTYTPRQIEAFLTAWSGKEILLLEVHQYENRATGYPLWRLDYRFKGERAKVEA